MFNNIKKIIPVKVKSFIKNPIKYISNSLWIIYVKNKDVKKIKIKEYKPGEENVIVSVTSYGERLNSLYIVIKSIILQSIKPNKIILYLGNDVKKEEIPLNLLFLENINLLDIVYKEENLLSYKKFVYAMQDYPNDVIITIDDDLVYEKKMLELLLKSYKKNPEYISAKRVHKIVHDIKGRALPYNKWIKNYSKIHIPSDDLFATTGAGTLFPPSIFNNISNIAYDKNIFLKLCPKADDIWIKFMSVLSKKKIVYVKGKNDMPLIISGTQDNALYNSNVIMNDEYIKQMSKYFKIKL